MIKLSKAGLRQLSDVTKAIYRESGYADSVRVSTDFFGAKFRISRPCGGEVKHVYLSFSAEDMEEMPIARMVDEVLDAFGALDASETQQQNGGE